MSDETQQPISQKIGMLQDAPGSTSSMRVVMMLWMVVLIAGIAFLIVVNHAFPDVPQSIVELTSAVLLGKVGHSFSESWAGKQ